MEFCETLPHTAAGRHISGQLLRSATSVAANYAEASEAESPADFIHKLKIAQKELKESRVWLVFASRLVPGTVVESLREESRELLLMIGKSINTASARNQGQKRSKLRLDAYAKEKERARPMVSPKMGNGTLKSRHDQSDWEAGYWLHPC